MWFRNELSSLAEVSLYMEILPMGRQAGTQGHDEAIALAFRNFVIASKNLSQCYSVDTKPKFF